jgi:nucleoside phosphorylase
MKAEADIAMAKFPGDSVVIGAGNSRRLRAQLSRLSTNIYTSVVSFGVCGGLHEGLAVGQLLSGDAVIGQDKIVADPSAKLLLGRRSGAFGVDTETHIAKEYAESRNIPFQVARAVLDTVDQQVPPAALLPLNRDGSPDKVAIAKSVFFHPFQIPMLVQLGLQQNTALKMLKEVTLL